MPLAYEIERLVVRLDALTAPYQAALKQAEEATKGFAAAAAQSAAGAAKAFGVLVAPVAALAAKAVQSSAGFEHAMAMIEGLAGQSQEQVAAWSKQILDLAPTVGKAPEELAKGLYMLASGGLRGQQAMDALGIASKLSAAGMGEVSTIARGMKAAMNAYASTGLTAAAAADTLTAAVQQSKLEADALAPVIGRVIPMASAMGVSFSEALGPLAAMTRTGASAAEAGTALQAFFATLSKPARQSQQVLAAVGLSFGQLRNVVQGPSGVYNVMQLLERSFGGNEEAMARAFPNIRALRGVLNLLSQDGGKVSEILDNVRNSTGAAGVAFDAIAKTAAFQAQQRAAQLASALSELGDTVRGVIAPAMDAYGQTLRAVTLWWRGLDESTQKAIVGWGVVATSAVAVMASLKGLSMLLGMLKIGQLLSAALWGIWSAAVIAAKVALGTLAITLAFVKVALSGALVLWALWTPMILAAKVATWLWNAALVVLNGLLSPAVILGAAIAIGTLGAALAVAYASVVAVNEAGRSLVEALGSLPTTYGPVQHIGGLFREWGSILSEVWTLLQTNGPAAWSLLAAGARLAFEQVRDLLPPLWVYMRGGFEAVAEFLTARLTAAFQEAMTRIMSSARQGRIGKLFGFDSEEEAASLKAWSKDMEFLKKSAGDLFGARMDSLSRGFDVSESSATKAARSALESLRNENEWSDLLDQVDEVFGSVEKPAKLAENAFKGAGVNLDLLTNKGKKVKDSLRVDAVDFFSAEAQSRLDAYREAFAPSLAGTSKTSKSEDYLRQIAQNTQKTADEPGFDIEGADFEE